MYYGIFLAPRKHQTFKKKKPGVFPDLVSVGQALFITPEVGAYRANLVFLGDSLGDLET